MRDRYIIADQEATYFLTMTVVHWIDLFTRREYKDIVVDSLNYCIGQKGVILYGWMGVDDQSSAFDSPDRKTSYDERIFT